MANFLQSSYKWWYLFWYEFKRSNTHWFGFLFSNFLRIAELLVAVYVWVLNGAGAGIITYLALGHAFERLSKSPFGSVLGAYINNGSHTKALIRPQSVFLYYFISDLGFNQTRLITSSILGLILAKVLFGSMIIWKIDFVLYLILFWPIAIGIRYFFNVFIGSLAFWIPDRANSSSIAEGLYMLVGVLAGEIIPLGILFKDGLSFLSYNPFAWFLHIPMQVYLGNFSNYEVWLAILGGVVWCVLLYILAKLTFTFGLKKNESVGL